MEKFHKVSIVRMRSFSVDRRIRKVWLDLIVLKRAPSISSTYFATCSGTAYTVLPTSDMIHK